MKFDFSCNHSEFQIRSKGVFRTLKFSVSTRLSLSRCNYTVCSQRESVLDILWFYDLFWSYYSDLHVNFVSFPCLISWIY
jgi:hypothetical protein